jgi:hypothetical protein
VRVKTQPDKHLERLPAFEIAASVPLADVLDFLNEEVREIFVGDLNYEGHTVRVPVEPQKPLVENWCDLGMSR